MERNARPQGTRAFFRLLVLTALGFVLGTYEFVVVGILPEIAEGMQVSLAAVGKLVSAFAGAYAVGTPFLTAAMGRIPRFRLLMELMAAFMGTTALSMLAPNVAVLYLSQMLAALVSGPLTAVGMLFARELAEEGHAARALAMVYAGFSLASLVGVPLGTAVCRWLGWRWTYGLILLMSAALLPVLAAILPRNTAVPMEKAGVLHAFTVFRDRRCALCAGMIFFSGTATYMVYTFLPPIMTDLLGVPADAVSLLLVVVGVCCMGSNLISGWMGERGGVRWLPLIFGMQALLFAAMPLLLLRGTWTGLAALLAMSLLMYVLNTPSQLYALTLAEREYPFATVLCSSMLSVCYNLGIAVGSFLGSGLQETAGLGALGVPAAVFALVGLGLNLLLLRADTWRAAETAS